MFNECGAGPNFLFAHALLLQFASLQTNADSMDVKIENFHFKELMYLSISDGVGKYNCLPPKFTTATCSLFRLTKSMGMSYEIISL